MARRPLCLCFGVALWCTGVVPLTAQGTARRFALSETDTLAVTDSGAGPAVVLVPGLLGGAFGFRRVTAALAADGYRTIVIEPLGIGASSRPGGSDYSLEAQAVRIARVLEELHVDSAIFVCHSVAGSMCYRLALRAPAAVRAIVAINAGPDEHAATAAGLRFALRFAPLIRVIGGAGTARRRLRAGLIEGSADPAWVTAEVVEAYTRPFGDMDSALRALRGMAAARDTAPLAPRLGGIRACVLLLVGAGSERGTTSAADIDLLTRSIPDITVQRIGGAGQYIQEERPAAIIDAVAALHAQRARVPQQCRSGDPPARGRSTSALPAVAAR
ncbi:MAG TPA: alpha/beta fold hydrolase [Longimicrobiales bacterium]|nr:alpha/beta fold hydrolase [Longimicrobiales bacterium]